MERLTKRVYGIIIIAILAISVYSFGGTGTASRQAASTQGQAAGVQDSAASQTQTSNPQMPGDVNPNAVVSQQEQDHVMERVGRTPDLSEVYIDKTVDGRFVISATATLTDQESLTAKMSADRIIKTFIQNSYSVRPMIAGCMINVVQDNHLVAGAALGAAIQSQMAATTAAGDSNPAELVNFLQQHTDQSDDMSKNTWYYAAQ